MRNADQHSILQTYPLPLLHPYRNVCIYIYSKEMTPKYWVHHKVHSGFSNGLFWPRQYILLELMDSKVQALHHFGIELRHSLHQFQ